MRHLWSLVAGVVAAPLAWLLLATGQHRSQATVAGWERAGSFHTADLLGPALFLLVAGVGLGVLGTLRWSPAGPVAAGLLLLTPGVFMLINPSRTLEAFSYGQQRRLFGQDLQPWLPVENGTLLVLGALLLVAAVSAERWRRWPESPRPIPPATDEEVIAGVAALTQGSDSSPMSDDEILAAAAALDERAQRGEEAGATGTAAPAGAEPRPAEPGESGKDSGPGSAPASPPSAKPAKSAKSAKPAKSTKSTKATKSVKSAKPKAPGGSVDHADTTGAGESSGGTGAGSDSDGTRATGRGTGPQPAKPASRTPRKRQPRKRTGE